MYSITSGCDLDARLGGGSSVKQVNAIFKFDLIALLDWPVELHCCNTLHGPSVTPALRTVGPHTWFYSYLGSKRNRIKNDIGCQATEGMMVRNQTTSRLPYGSYQEDISG